MQDVCTCGFSMRLCTIRMNGALGDWSVSLGCAPWGPFGACSQESWIVACPSSRTMSPESWALTRRRVKPVWPMSAMPPVEESLPWPSSSESTIIRFASPLRLVIAGLLVARIRLFLIVTFFALIVSPPLTSLPSMTVPLTVIVDGPLYGVSVTGFLGSPGRPWGYPVLAAFGKPEMVNVALLFGGFCDASALFFGLAEVLGETGAEADAIGDSAGAPELGGLLGAPTRAGCGPRQAATAMVSVTSAAAPA